MNNLFLKHRLYRDVCFRVLKHQYTSDTYYKLKIEWWNLGCENSWCMGIRQVTKIYNNDLHNWLYTEDMVNCLRDANWKEFKK